MKPLDGNKKDPVPEVVRELLERPVTTNAGDKFEATKKLLLETAFKKFMKFGTRRVTMDEIARDLRISKRRIYEFFPSKEALVKACIDHFSMMILPRMMNAFNSSGGVSERFIAMQKVLADLSAVITSEFVTDLKLEFPNLWEMVDERRTFVIGNFEKVIEEGIKSGEIWPNVHPKAVMSIILNTVLHVVSPEALSTGDFTPRQALYSMLTMIGRGLFVKPMSVDELFNDISGALPERVIENKNQGEMR